jgi:hypothetical protein
VPIKVNVQFFHPDQQDAALGLVQGFAIGAQTRLTKTDGGGVFQASVANLNSAEEIEALIKAKNAQFKASGQPELEFQTLKPEF